MRLFCIMILSALVVAMGYGQTAYRNDIDRQGYSAQSQDLSDSAKLRLPQPSLAYVNLISPDGMPADKHSDLHAWVEYYDPSADTYFRKHVLANQQGQTSTNFPKQNVAIDFCQDEWLGDSVPSVVFDGWVRQDAFHLKSFYTDWLRGIGIVGYQLYDEMERLLPEDRNRIWKRAGVDANAKARCYPDGFPCALYLNGEFYGIYAWQLKKHRRNTGMEKHCETHIHLDGNLGENTFWQGTIRWRAFEVRNPKGLLTKDGKPYNSDVPSELADGPVKDAIVALSHRCAELSDMQKAGADADAIRNMMARYFDVESMLNYIIFSTVTSNYDGFSKNWQWLTYDGQKWYVAPYDLDCTFGNFHGGTFVFPAELTYINSTFSMNKTRPAIAEWFWSYYFDELTQRYFQLRQAGIFTAQHIADLQQQWYQRIGDDLYQREWECWPDSYCISETIANDGWMATDDWLWYYGLQEWSETRIYHIGDRCRLADRVWKATAETQGVFPYLQLGYTDSLERLAAWTSERIELEDGYFGYEEGQTIVHQDAPIASSPSTDPVQELIHKKTSAVYGLDGMPRRRTAEGFNIVRQDDGKVIIVSP